MVRQLALGVIASAFAVHSTAQANVEGFTFPGAESKVMLQAIVEAGTTSACGLREAPHLIEHLLLSDTQYGASPVDAILSLRKGGISLSATTHLDYTEYTLEGSADKAAQMEDALIAFLGRRSLPKAGFEQEKRVILNELRVSDDYRSSPTLFERFTATHSGATAPCAADATPFRDYSYPEVQQVFAEHYTPENIKLVAQAPEGLFNLAEVGRALSVSKDTPGLISQHGSQEVVGPTVLISQGKMLELVFPIAGRAELPADGARALADQIRLEVQADIRKTEGMYAARTFVDQGLKGGWIRLEVPGLAPHDAMRIADVAKGAISRISLHEHSTDPIWKAYGEVMALNPILDPIAAFEPSAKVNGKHAALAFLGVCLAALVAPFLRKKQSR